MIIEFLSFLGKTIASKFVSKAVDSALPEVTSYFDKTNTIGVCRPPRSGDLRMVQRLIGYDHSSKELKKKFVCQIFEKNNWSDKEEFSDQQDCLNYMAELQSMQDVVYMDNEVGAYCKQESANLPGDKILSRQVSKIQRSAEDWFLFIFKICLHAFFCIATVAFICYAFWGTILGGFMLLIIAGPFAILNYEVLCYDVNSFITNKKNVLYSDEVRSSWPS